MFNGALRDNLLRIKDRVYIKLDGKQIEGMQWVSLFINRNTAVYCDSFGID